MKFIHNAKNNYIQIIKNKLNCKLNVILQNIIIEK